MTIHTSPMRNSVDSIKRANSLKRTIAMYIRDAARRQRYWTCSTVEYRALCHRLDALYLRWNDFGYSIVERSDTGAVRIAKI